jgi:hypothetical protein
VRLPYVCVAPEHVIAALDEPKRPKSSRARLAVFQVRNLLSTLPTPADAVEDAVSTPAAP